MKLVLGAAVAHALVAIACVVWMRIDAVPILGVHPAAKPLKFAISIALFLASMAYLLPALSVGEVTRAALAWALTGAMSLEMLVIAVQALRGQRSHFNTVGAFDTAMVVAMFVGIGVLVVAMIAIIGAATRPLAAPPLLAWAWRAALGFFVLVVVTGVAMGGRASHTVGAVDGGPGRPFTNWSTAHGDLRIAHFVALHALQILPVAGWALTKLPIGDPARATTLALVVASLGALVAWTLTSALAGRPI